MADGVDFVAAIRFARLVFNDSAASVTEMIIGTLG
jgi:hypothetical protein